jgi:hypothetical protein
MWHAHTQLSFRALLSAVLFDGAHFYYVKIVGGGEMEDQHKVSNARTNKVHLCPQVLGGLYFKTPSAKALVVLFSVFASEGNFQSFANQRLL